MATIPSPPNFSGVTVPSVTQMNALSYAVSFLVNDSVRPTWNVYRNSNFSCSINTWEYPTYNVTVYDSDSVMTANPGYATINTQGYYALEACTQIEDISSVQTFVGAFQVYGGPNNPHISQNSAYWFGFKGLGTATTQYGAPTDGMCLSDITPFCLYPGDQVFPAYCAGANMILDPIGNFGYQTDRFVFKFSGYWVNSGT